jgi:hypothetical protein
MEQPQEAFEHMAKAPTFLLLKQAGMHFALWLVAFSLFAATDSWATITGWSLASLLNVFTGIAAGFITVNLVHEWFHYFGARFVSGTYTISDKPSLFVFDWNFEKNDLQQFYTMSIAGTVGGIVALLAVINAIDTNSAGRAALVAGAAASFAFGSIIEWPVLARTRRSKNPMGELSKISPGVLGRASAGSAIVGLLSWVALT